MVVDHLLLDMQVQMAKVDEELKQAQIAAESSASKLTQAEQSCEKLEKELELRIAALADSEAKVPHLIMVFPIHVLLRSIRIIKLAGPSPLFSPSCSISLVSSRMRSVKDQ